MVTHVRKVQLFEEVEELLEKVLLGIPLDYCIEAFFEKFVLILDFSYFFKQFLGWLRYFWQGCFAH